MGYPGVLGFIALKKDKAKAKDSTQAENVSESARARRLILERYGASSARQESSTQKWWIVTESGEILCSGPTEEDAWIHSAFMPIDEPRYSISVEPSR